jgi:hypothetical protein
MKESAFPFIETSNPGDSVSPGLSKREIFAMAAMQGLLSGMWASEERLDCRPETVATIAVNHADKLLAELSKA